MSQFSFRTCYKLLRLFSLAWFESMSQQNIISNFRCTGICPFNREAIQLPIRQSIICTSTSLEEQTGLNFIPLYSYASSPSVRCSRTHNDNSFGDTSSDEDQVANASPAPSLHRQTSVS